MRQNIAYFGNLLNQKGIVFQQPAKGSTPTSYGYSYKKQGIRFIKAENIDGKGLASTTSDFIDEDTHEFLKRSKLQTEDLLFSIAGTIGRVGIVRAIDLPANTNQALAIVRPRKEIVDPRYLFHFLSSPSIKQQTSARTAGVGRANVSLTDVGEFEVVLPNSLEQQRVIVAEIEKQFSRLDEAVTALKRIQANLKRYKAAVLKAAVEGKLTEQRRRRGGLRPPSDPADGGTTGRMQCAPTETGADLIKRILAERRAKWEAEELAKMKAKGIKPKDDSWKKKYKEPAGPDTANLPELPEGWVWASVDQLANVMLGKMLDKAKHQTGRKMAYLRNVNIRWGHIDTTDLLEMFFEDDELARYGLKEGDVLVCEGGEPGRAAVWNGKFPDMKYQKALHRVRCCEGYDPRMLVVLLEHLAKSGRLEKWFTGSTIKHFTRESFVQLPVPLPSLTEQQRIAEEIDRRLSVTEELEATIETNLKRAERLRQTILQRAFAGG